MVRDVIETVSRATSLRVGGDLRPGDAAFLISGVSRAQGELGWRPRFGDLGDIVATARACHQRTTSVLNGASA